MAMGDSGHIIPVWNGLLEPPHPEQMGPAVWVFLWLLDKQTDDNEGIVLGGRPIQYTEIADFYQTSSTTIGDHVRRLKKYDYIVTKTVRKGTTYRIAKPKKWKRPKKPAPKKTTRPWGERWAQVCAIAARCGWEDFEDIELDFHGARGIPARGLAQSFSKRSDEAIEAAFRSWAAMVRKLEAEGQLNMVPTNAETRLKKLIVFADRKKSAKPVRPVPTNDPQWQARYAELDRRKAELKRRQEKGEDVRKEMAALTDDYRALRRANA